MMRSVVIAFALAIVAPSVSAGELVNVSGAGGIALNGYDPVAFFTDHRPVRGDSGITSMHEGGRYLFATREHKMQFDANPEKYVPQFGGFCALGVSGGGLFPVDIDTWQILDGKLYLNKNQGVKKRFNEDPKAAITKAEKNWPELVKKSTK